MSYRDEIAIATHSYWSASGRVEEKLAYYSILLLGGRDGYPPSGRFRCAVARLLRLAALRVERRWR